MNTIEIINRGNEALIKELGIEGMIEYIQSFGLGYGNYARDRKRWLKDQKVEDLVKEIEMFKKMKKNDS
ncbi:MAG: hypothetical protein JSV88_07965 [Candidatus Aminicenantes bacterium]|nr:MAG: hypothetical protein JSV88_07965 [Candidatus Aminicenantes bacterium]